MKTKNRQILAMSTVLALTFSIAITSCKKDKDDSGASAQFSATINGTAFKPSIVSAFTFFSYIEIIGYEARSGGDTLMLDLSIPSDATVDTKITFENNAGLDYYNTKGTIEYGNYGDSHGTVTLTSVDKTNKKIAGTFNCVLYNPNSSSDSLVVKDGKFNTTYTAF
jgi:hypothetical protein